MDYKYCQSCSFSECGRCNLLAGANTSQITKCGKNYDFYKESTKEWNLDSLASFLLDMDPIILLKYLSRSRAVAVGDVVVALTGQFNTSRPGKILKVKEINDIGITLVDSESREYVVEKDEYFHRIFKLDE